MKVHLLSLVGLFLTSCGSVNPVQIFEDEIRSFGFIPYKNPLEHAKTGTLVGGAPDRMALVAPPETCFPDRTKEGLTELRNIDNTSLPNRRRSFSFAGNLKFSIFEILNQGNPTVRAGVQFSKIEKVELEFEQPKIEYMDLIKLTKFYRSTLPEGCADYLEHVGFIIEAIRVDKMKFVFYDKDSGRVNLELDKIDEILDIASDVRWRIENEFSFVIDSPKYIGYRLGRLKASDEGMALYRASRVEENRFKFESIDIFGPIEPAFTTSSFRSLNLPSVDEHSDYED